MEYLVTGFVSEMQGGRINFSLKAIETRDGRVLLSRKISTSFDKVGREAGQIFHEREVVDRYDTLYVEKVRQEPRVRYITKTFPAQQTSKGDNTALLLMIVVVLIWAGVYFL